MAGQFSWASTRVQPHPASEGSAIEVLSAGIPEPVPMPTSRPQEGEVVVADLPFSSLQLSASLVSYLELTQSQIVIVMIQVLVGAERQRIEPVLTRLSANRQLLVTATKNGRFDEKHIRKLATQQSRLMAELIVATSRFQAEVYSLLTPEQRGKVDDARDRQDDASETEGP